MTVAPTGTSAWRRLFSGMRRPRLANMLRMRSAIVVVGAELDAHDLGDALAGDVVVRRTEAAAHDHRVAALESEAERRHDAGQVVADLGLEVRVDARRAASCSPIHDELVSTIWPSSSSVPTATTSQRRLTRLVAGVAQRLRRAVAAGTARR